MALPIASEVDRFATLQGKRGNAAHLIGVRDAAVYPRAMTTPAHSGADRAPAM